MLSTAQNQHRKQPPQIDQTKRNQKNIRASVLEPFLNKEYRDSFIDGYVKSAIAFQIQALRKKSGLNQKKFGKKIGKLQSVVSRLENTEYGGVSINTLIDIAKAMNVGLQVRFTNYVNILTDDVSPSAFLVDDIHETAKNITNDVNKETIEKLPAKNAITTASTRPPARKPMKNI